MSKNNPSKEDTLLFRNAVNALKNHETADLHRAKTKGQLTKENPKNIPPLFLSDFYAEPVSSSQILSHQTHALPKGRFNALKAGEIRYEGRLDLHHMTVDKAREALVDFIRAQHQLQHRVVLIIHGKGDYHGKAPILKNLTFTWLKQIPEVLGFHSAKPKDGGTGAVYVLLSRAD